MKWKNKGHEFDQYAEKLLALNSAKKFYIFGAGNLGRELLPVFQHYECIVAFIDNNTEKQGSKIKGTEVISFEQYMEKKDGQIVIAMSPENTEITRKQLEKNSLIHKRDFFFYREFIHHVFPIFSVYGFDKSYVSLAQITLTERCTLKCAKCSHGCFAVNNCTSVDMTLEQVYKSVDSFFSKVDFIKEFVLIGGEPLLYQNLEQVIEYIGGKYAKKIGTYSITTNGTVLPDGKVLKACRKYNVLFRISNYSHEMPELKKNYQRLENILEEYEISFIFGEEETMWMDYGFDYLDRGTAEDELMEVFDACKTPCREIRESRFYFCVMARSISENMRFNIGQNDYLDLDKLDGKNYKKVLLEFTQGFSDKGYLDMCRHCYGSEAKNHLIVAAEQMKKGGNGGN